MAKGRVFFPPRPGDTVAARGRAALEVTGINRNRTGSDAVLFQTRLFAVVVNAADLAVTADGGGYVQAC